MEGGWSPDASYFDAARMVYVVGETESQSEENGGVGSLVDSLQFGTKSDELTGKNPGLFADEVLPDVRSPLGACQRRGGPVGGSATPSALDIEVEPRPAVNGSGRLVVVLV